MDKNSSVTPIQRLHATINNLAVRLNLFDNHIIELVFLGLSDCSEGYRLERRMEWGCYYVDWKLICSLIHHHKYIPAKKDVNIDHWAKMHAVTSWHMAIHISVLRLSPCRFIILGVIVDCWLQHVGCLSPLRHWTQGRWSSDILYCFNCSKRYPSIISEIRFLSMIVYIGFLSMIL